MIEKYKLDGEVYYFINGKFCDSQYCIVSDPISEKLFALKFEKINYQSFDSGQLLTLIVSTKEQGSYLKAKQLIDFGLEKFEKNYNFIRHVLPIYTSCCRNLNMQKQGLKIATLFLNSKTASVMLYVSMAATYCDLKDLSNAKIYAAKASFLYKEHNIPISSELDNVYLRIQKEQNIDN